MSSILRYVRVGRRSFGKMPITPHSRANWEFFAVIDGQCGLQIDVKKCPVRSSRLWVFPPGHVHGWHGGKDACEVAVCHFSQVPSQLADSARKHGFLDIGLNAAECARVCQLAVRMRREYLNPTGLSDLYYQHALLDLSLLALRRASTKNLTLPENIIPNKVDAAITWYRSHLRENPSLTAVAKAVHLSTSHLRRLFMASHHVGPHDVLNEVRLEIAMTLLRETDLKLEAVAAEAGFSGGSDLSRAFKQRHGCSPGAWRKRTYR